MAQLQAQQAQQQAHAAQQQAADAYTALEQSRQMSQPQAAEVPGTEAAKANAVAPPPQAAPTLQELRQVQSELKRTSQPLASPLLPLSDAPPPCEPEADVRPPPSGDGYLPEQHADARADDADDADDGDDSGESDNEQENEEDGSKANEHGPPATRNAWGAPPTDAPPFPTTSASSPALLGAASVYADPHPASHEVDGGAAPHGAAPQNACFEEVAEVTVQGRGTKGKPRRSTRSKLNDLTGSNRRVDSSNSENCGPSNGANGQPAKTIGRHSYLLRPKSASVATAKVLVQPSKPGVAQRYSHVAPRVATTRVSERPATAPNAEQPRRRAPEPAAPGRWR